MPAPVLHLSDWTITMDHCTMTIHGWSKWFKFGGHVIDSLYGVAANHAPSFGNGDMVKPAVVGMSSINIQRHFGGDVEVTAIFTFSLDTY